MAHLHPLDDTHAFRFCPRCGHALEERVIKAGEPPRLVCTSCDFVFYLDPKIAVGTIIRATSGRIVLVRRAIEPGYGKWVFPGGYVDRGEALHAAAIREAREECGLDVRLDGLINVYSYAGRAPVIAPTRDRARRRPQTDDEGLEAAGSGTGGDPWDELALPQHARSAPRLFADFCIHCRSVASFPKTRYFARGSPARR